MLVKDLVEKFDLSIAAGKNGLDREIMDGYCGDLLSEIMGNAPAGCVWLTVQGHQNIVAVAVLLPSDISFTSWVTWPLMVLGTYIYYVKTGQSFRCSPGFFRGVWRASFTGTGCIPFTNGFFTACSSRWPNPWVNP